MHLCARDWPRWAEQHGFGGQRFFPAPDGVKLLGSAGSPKAPKCWCLLRKPDCQVCLCLCLCLGPAHPGRPRPPPLPVGLSQACPRGSPTYQALLCLWKTSFTWRPAKTTTKVEARRPGLFFSCHSPFLELLGYCCPDYVKKGSTLPSLTGPL